MHQRRDLLLAAATLAAPGVARAQATPLTLQVTTSVAFIGPYYDELARAFQAANPDVRVAMGSPMREFEELAQLTLRQAVIGQLPDLSMQGSQQVRLYVDRGIAVRLDPFLAEDGAAAAEGIGPTVTEQGRIGGAVHALGLGFSAPVLVFNLDLVRRAGGDPDALPGDWPAILDLVRRLNGIGGGVHGGIFQYGSSGNWTFHALIESHGGRMTTPDERRVAFGDAAGLASLRVLRAFGEAGQAARDMTRDQGRQFFASGQLGMIVDASSALGIYERMAAGRFDVRAVPFPLPSQHGRIPAAGLVGAMFTRDPARQRAAWRLLRFAAGADGQAILGTRTALAPFNLRAIAADPLAGHYAARPNMQAVLAQVPRLGRWYAFPGANGVKIVDVIRNHLQSVVVLRRGPEEALPAMVRDVQALLPA